MKIKLKTAQVMHVPIFAPSFH
jgi:hypothetical protein